MRIFTTKSLMALILSAMLSSCAVENNDNAQTSAATNDSVLMSGEHFKKVVYVVFENEDLAPVNQQADFARIATYGTSFTQMFGETHPSQPNYVAMISGSTMGVTNDNNYDLNQTHLGDSLEAKGLDWKVYAEAYPGNCFLAAGSGTYDRKHVPFLSFTNVTKNSARCAKITNSTSFITDFKNHTLPAFSMYIPDENNNGHDTGVDFAGKWLTKTFGDILSHPELLEDVLFVLTFDEGNSGNNIYTVLIGKNIFPDGTNTQKLDHIALLKMVQDEYSLGNLGRLDATAPAIQGIWK